MRPDICIYHGNCADGFGAAWAVWRRFGDAVRYVPAFYGQEPPDVACKNVVLVDFSYKLSVLRSMLASGDVDQAETILILDHHKTAAEDLRDIRPPDEGYDPETWRRGWESWGTWPVRCQFDMNRSGAVMAWEFFHPGEPVPALLQYVQDRDLWRFNLPRSREVAAWVFSHPYAFPVWDELSALINGSFESVVREGAAIERKHHKDIAEMLLITRREMMIGGHRVPVANLPYTMASDAAGILATGAPFGACYFDRADGKRQFSLRSRDSGLDVSEIAKVYGGGGHRNAAGFEVPIGWDGDDGGFIPVYGTKAP
jgi:hypothetical protein